MIRSRLIFLLFGSLTLGCQPVAAPPAQAAKDEQVAAFDPKATGTIRGRVVWDGDLPEVPPLRHLGFDREAPEPLPNPHRPHIDPKSRGVQGALITLRKVDPANAAPWRHLPVSAVFTKNGLEVRQGDEAVPIGIVRKGDTLACSATEKRNFLLVARGEAFFSLPLPQPDRVTTRRLDKPGHVELTCGRGRYWLRGHVWVTDHPYVTMTKAQGAFALEQVPAGTYDILAWLPNWNVLRHERSPETGEIERLLFQTPVEQTQSVTVVVGASAEVDFRWTGDAFRPRKSD